MTDFPCCAKPYTANEMADRLGIPRQRDERQHMTDKLDSLVTDWLDRKRKLEKDRGILDDVGALIMEALAVGERHTLTGMPGVGVRVQGPRCTLNDEAARLVLSAETYAEICEMVPSIKLAEAIGLSAKTRAMFYRPTPGAPFLMELQPRRRRS